MCGISHNWYRSLFIGKLSGRSKIQPEILIQISLYFRKYPVKARIINHLISTWWICWIFGRSTLYRFFSTWWRNLIDAYKVSQIHNSYLFRYLNTMRLLIAVGKNQRLKRIIIIADFTMFYLIIRSIIVSMAKKKVNNIFSSYSHSSKCLYHLHICS